MKRTALVAVFSMTLLLSPPASAAGIPVIDVAAIAKAVEQIRQLTAQLDTMKQQLAAITGNRGMAGLIADQARNYLPEEWHQTLTALGEAGDAFGELASRVQQLRMAHSILSDADREKLTPDARQILDAARRNAATQQAIGELAYKNASQRVALLQQLTNKINTATDPKAIWDLQARIQSEQTLLQNEQIKLATIQQLQQAEADAHEQMLYEYSMQQSGTGEFPHLITTVNR